MFSVSGHLDLHSGRVMAHFEAGSTDGVADFLFAVFVAEKDGPERLRFVAAAFTTDLLAEHLRRTCLGGRTFAGLRV